MYLQMVDVNERYSSHVTLPRPVLVIAEIHEIF